MVAPGSHILFCKIKVQNDVAPDLQFERVCSRNKDHFLLCKVSCAIRIPLNTKFLCSKSIKYL